ncbi:MAG: hypothetical protein GY929_15575 [Actinomycetia bacterium]|nr:hypothetical protein [Actinomycetes bacterium]
MWTRSAAVLVGAAVLASACGSGNEGPGAGRGGGAASTTTTVSSIASATARDRSGSTATDADTTTTIAPATTSPPTSSDRAPDAFELFRVSYDTETDAVIAHTNLGEIRSDPRELPNGPGSGKVWGAIDFDGDGVPEILTLDPQGAHTLWTSIYRITPEELVFSDAFMVGGNLWMTGALDCHDRTGDGIADLTHRDAIYDEDEVLWQGYRTDYAYVDGSFIDEYHIDAELPGPQAIADDAQLPEGDIFGPTTCSPAPAGPGQLAADIAFGGSGWLGADDLETRFDDPSVIEEMERVSSIQGPFSVARCNEPTDVSGECWLLAEVTEVGLTMSRTDWETGWHVTDVRFVHGE